MKQILRYPPDCEMHPTNRTRREVHLANQPRPKFHPATENTIHIEAGFTQIAPMGLLYTTGETPKRTIIPRLTKLHRVMLFTNGEAPQE